MAGSPKAKLQTQEASSEEVTEAREVFLRDGKKLVVSDEGADQLVEVRSSSGMVEVRIRLTEQGPVLQMESVRLELKASEAVAIESQRVEIKGTERVEVASEGEVQVTGEQDVKVDSSGDVRVVGKMIYLN